MKCPYCSHQDSKVTDSREATDWNAIRRRRECLQCGKRFTTFETVELAMQVQKRDGRYEDFQQHKLIKGLEAACRHTKISHDQVIALAAKITCELQQRGLREISTTELGNIVMHHLLGVDPIAYVRFACVYQRIADVNELIEVIQRIQPKEQAVDI